MYSKHRNYILCVRTYGTTHSKFKKFKKVGRGGESKNTSTVRISNEFEDTCLK